MAMVNDDEVDFNVSQFRYERDALEQGAAHFPIIDASVNTSRALPCLKAAGVDTMRAARLLLAEQR